MVRKVIAFQTGDYGACALTAASSYTPPEFGGLLFVSYRYSEPLSGDGEGTDNG